MKSKAMPNRRARLCVALLFLATFSIFGTDFDGIYQKYGVRIETDAKAIVPSYWRKPTASGKCIPLDPSLYPKALEILELALKEYPKRFLSKHLKAIAVCHELSFYGVKYGGTAVYSEKKVVLTIKKWTSAQWAAGTIHHELNHILLHHEKFPKYQWQGANKPGFRYGKGGLEAIRNGQASTAYTAAAFMQGFVNQYGSSALIEDVATMIEFAMVEKIRFNETVRKYPIIHRKFGILKKFYYDLDPHFNEDYWSGNKSGTGDRDSFVEKKRISRIIQKQTSKDITIKTMRPRLTFKNNFRTLVISQDYSANGQGTLKSILYFRKGSRWLKQGNAYVMQKQDVPVSLTARQTKQVSFTVEMAETIWPNIPDGKISLSAYIYWQKKGNYLKDQTRFVQFWIQKPSDSGEYSGNQKVSGFNLNVSMPTIRFSNQNQNAVISQDYQAVGKGRLTATLYFAHNRRWLSNNGQYVMVVREIALNASQTSSETISFPVNMAESIWPLIGNGRQMITSYVYWKFNNEDVKEKTMYVSFSPNQPSQ